MMLCCSLLSRVVLKFGSIVRVTGKSVGGRMRLAQNAERSARKTAKNGEDRRIGGMGTRAISAPICTRKDRQKEGGERERKLKVKS